jgi:hypothetical protein
MSAVDPNLKGLLCRECGTQVTREEPNPDDEQEQMWYCPKCDWWYHSVHVEETDTQLIKLQLKPQSRKSERMKKLKDLLWRFKVWRWQQGDEAMCALAVVIVAVVTFGVIPLILWVLF